MRLSLSLFVLLAVGLVAFAEPVPHILHERRSRIPSGWTALRRHERLATLPLRFGLKQSNLDKLDEFLHDIAHPESANYGKHWTAGEVASTFAPARESLDAVRGWLVTSGVPEDRVRTSSSKNWVEVIASVEEAERLLNTEYHVYGHDSGKQHIGCSSYHLPSDVSPHVDIVTPSIHFDTVVGKRDSVHPTGKHGASPNIHHIHASPSKHMATDVSTAASALDICSTEITPACIKALYGINYSPQSPTKNSFGIVEYTPQSYLQADLDLFAKNVSGITALVGKSPNLVSVDGGFAQTEATGFEYNGESSLDLQYAMSIVGVSQAITLYQVGDMIEGASFNNFLDALDGSYCKFEGGDDPFQDVHYPDTILSGYRGGPDCGTAVLSNVISTSYSYNEADLGPDYTARQCAEYAKLGLMGVTVLFSSGDSGVAGRSGFCLSSDGFSLSDGTMFDPAFPSTCPYVTSVGATQIKSGGTVNDSEVACEVTIQSGGGFSNYFATPDYQQGITSGYLKQNKPVGVATSRYNATGTSRGYPDISANGAGYLIVADGQLALVSGTSASAPVVAAMITLINDARITAGKKPVGFINPSLYSSAFASAYNDIVQGSNPGCGTIGFNATTGWDPVTGLGTPNFPKLMDAFMSLP
ncbi:peptidase S8/S53 domain-containing protein [Cyathus striatus]|nr:peptidase S8/S53 domain-containing protein [Cyathus striatus]